MLIQSTEYHNLWNITEVIRVKFMVSNKYN